MCHKPVYVLQLSDTISELTVVESVDDEEELEVEDDLEQGQQLICYD